MNLDYLINLGFTYNENGRYILNIGDIKLDVSVQSGPYIVILVYKKGKDIYGFCVDPEIELTKSIIRKVVLLGLEIEC